MKQIVLMRHGKAETPGKVSDAERKLTERGQRDSLKIGSMLFESALIPDLLLVSPAVRTKETALMVLQSSQVQTKIVPALYNATPQSLELIIRTASDNYNRIGIVGHNPTVTELILQTGFEIGNLPTAGAAVITFENLESWKLLSFPDGYISNLFMPKEPLTM